MRTNKLNPCACIFHGHQASADVVLSKLQTFDKKYLEESLPSTKNYFQSLLCPCIGGESKPKSGIFKEKETKRWRLELETAAYLVLSEARDRHIRLQQRSKGIRSIDKLVKRMKKEAIELKDEDVVLLIRCCLSAKRFFAQRIDNGEYLMRSLLHTAHLSYIRSISNIPRKQNYLIAASILRFLHEDDRWNSCDFGVKVLRILMSVQGSIHGGNAETEIFYIFVAHLAPYCPGLLIPVPSFEQKTSTIIFHGGLEAVNSLEAIGSRNPILEMSRVLHGILANYDFRYFGEDGWIAFDMLLTIYIRIVDALDSKIHYTDESRPGLFNITRESKEWDMTESALRGCLRHFIDDVLSSKLRFLPCKNPLRRTSSDINDSDLSEMGKSAVKGKVKSQWDNLSQTLIVVLSRAIDKEVSQGAQYQLLDLISTATRMHVGYRTLRACLPETLLTLILKVAQLGDSGANLRSLKLLLHLIDRHSIRFHITVPRIFKESIHFANIKCDGNDFEYFWLYRKDVYDTLYKNFLTHSSVLSNLETLFCTVCLILIEIQFPHIARDIAELMVNIQDAIIDIPDLPIQSPRVSAWIHTIVISVLSFIACIHGLTDLEILVSEVKTSSQNQGQIVNRRSEVAPFLIPPLKAKYTIGDITDFKEDLFFSHALIRRCLTNACFETRKVRVDKTQHDSSALISDHEYSH